jgi:uncharacterized cofD-like protein
MRRIRIARQANWLLPGLSIKRWVGLSALGSIILLLGLALFLNLHPIALTYDFFRILAPILPPALSGPLLILFGVLFLIIGSRQTYSTVYTALTPSGQASGHETSLLDTLVKRRKLDKGPKIVAIGGGTGLSTLLRGLKEYSNNITAVVTVGDDGGSSGRLREEQGIIPPGDIRNCIAALANEEELITSLFQYRFVNGQGLEGHSFGNLFLTAMCRVTGDMMSAIKESSKVLNISGRVLPASLDNITLVAEMEDGRIIRGESNIPEVRSKVKRLWCEPEQPQVLPEVLAAIAQADLILMGPGSLYTSIIPNLIMRPIAQAITISTARKAYVANIMTQPGETDGFSVADHLQAILEHAQGNVSSAQRLLDCVITNTILPDDLLAHYRQYGYQPVEADTERCKALGIDLIEAPLVAEGDRKSIRHNPQKLAIAIMEWYKTRSRH